METSRNSFQYQSEIGLEIFWSCRNLCFSTLDLVALAVPDAEALHGLLLLRVPTVVLGRTLVGVPGGRLVLVPLVVWRVLGPVRLLRGPAWTVVRRITLLSALGGSGRRRERGEEEERRWEGRGDRRGEEEGEERRGEVESSDFS